MSDKITQRDCAYDSDLLSKHLRQSPAMRLGSSYACDFPLAAKLVSAAAQEVVSHFGWPKQGILVQALREC